MKKIGYILICSVLSYAFSACYHSLEKGYLEYIPYEGNEILIFQSDSNMMDTIFLTGIGKYDISGKTLRTYQAVNVNCTRTDPNYDRYLNGKSLVKIVAGKNAESFISFDIKLKNAWLYDLKNYSLAEFKSMSESELTIGDKTYKDVKIFEANEFAKYYENRDNYAERFYWSFSEGFLGLDKKNEKWRLVAKSYLNT